MCAEECQVAPYRKACNLTRKIKKELDSTRKGKLENPPLNRDVVQNAMMVVIWVKICTIGYWLCGRVFPFLMSILDCLLHIINHRSKQSDHIRGVHGRCVASISLHFPKDPFFISAGGQLLL